MLAFNVNRRNMKVYIVFESIMNQRLQEYQFYLMKQQSSFNNPHKKYGQKSLKIIWILTYIQKNSETKR